MVDGGKGQLNSAVRVLQELNLGSIDIIALAKGRERGKKGVFEGRKAPEQIFLSQRKNPLILPVRSKVLLLLEKIRDESHRFGLAYHKKLRHKKDFHSTLEDVPGVGEKIRKRLLRHFGSVDKVREASLNELFKVPYVKQKVAEALYNFFRS